MTLYDVEREGDEMAALFAIKRHEAEWATIQKEVLQTKHRMQACFAVGGAGCLIGLVLLFPPNINHFEWLSIDAVATAFSLVSGLNYMSKYDEQLGNRKSIEARLLSAQKKAAAPTDPSF